MEIKDISNDKLMREYVFEKKMVAHHRKLLSDLEEEIAKRFESEILKEKEGI